MNIFLTTCLLLVILSPVTALFCVGNERKECSGSCFIITINNKLNSTQNKKYERGCTRDCTSEKITFTTVGNNYFSIFKACCKFQLCNLSFTDRPKPKLNGLECPIYCQDGKGPKTVKCSDDETQCMDFVLVHGDAKVPDKVYKGCATPSFCEQASASMLDKHLTGNITRARCYRSFPSSK